MESDEIFKKLVVGLVVVVSWVFLFGIGLAWMWVLASAYLVIFDFSIRAVWMLFISAAAAFICPVLWKLCIREVEKIERS